MTSRPADQPITIHLLGPGTAEQIAWVDALDTEPPLDAYRVLVPSSIHLDLAGSTITVDKYVDVDANGDKLAADNSVATSTVVFHVHGSIPPLPRPWGTGD